MGLFFVEFDAAVEFECIVTSLSWGDIELATCIVFGCMLERPTGSFVDGELGAMASKKNLLCMLWGV